VEKTGAKISSIVNVIEKFYGEPRETVANARAILGIGGFQPKGQKECSITVTELFMERLESPKVVHGVRYEPGRSLSSIAVSQ
jgi:hypothetical protein